jgi:16S rRNA (cytosine967-C5)-methyltransferase
MASTGARPRLAAAQALTEVLDRGRALTDALDGLGRQLTEARDRAQVRRLCNRVLRNWPALDARVRGRLRKPLGPRNRWIHFLIAIALDEIDEGREPAPAVVHAAVEAVRVGRAAPMAGLVNAVLRGELRRPAATTTEADGDALRYGMPGWLARRIRTDWPEEADRILAAGNQPPPTWLRVNRRRSTRDAALAVLNDAGRSGTADPDLTDAIRLDHPAAIGDLPGFAEGHLSVQDAGAQSAIDLLDLAGGQHVLDACAAPGGKAAHILERADVDLLAIDSDAHRAARIESGWARLGLNGRIAVADAAAPETWWDGRPFDRILIDAPCSATGVLRRHPDVRWLRRETDIESNTETQDAILAALWPLLAPGGLLVYATCSILHAENRDRGRKFLERHADAEAVAFELPDSQACDPGRQILPGSRARDGFYYLVLRRLPDGAGDR